MSPNANVERLRQAAPAILPSLLLCDFSNLEREVRLLEEAGAEALHLDVMDGCFVPNITYGMPIVAAARRLTDLPLDVHLMIMDPGKYVAAFCEAGADLLTIHVETNGDSRPVLEHIRKLGMGTGIALDPATHEVRRNGELVALSPREFALLEALLEHPGRIFSRAQLEERLYGWGEEVESNVVEVHVHTLRRKLGTDFIRNVRGVGYRVAPVGP